MKNKSNNRKKVIVSNRLYPSQINELSMCCFGIKKEKLDEILSFIVNNGGRVISAIPACGVSRFMILNSLEGYKYDWYFVMSMCQKEIVDIFVTEVAKAFELNKLGNGFSFVLDVLGYMGAKGPFVE